MFIQNCINSFDHSIHTQNDRAGGVGGGVAQDDLVISINLTHDCSLARAGATVIAYRMKMRRARPGVTRSPACSQWRLSVNGTDWLRIDQLHSQCASAR
jgi:hypothetical protein